MNLLQLENNVKHAIEFAKECGEDPANITVSIQVEKNATETAWSTEVELIYDNNCMASGCVIYGWMNE